ncbi:class I SAM-dependent methyltransferase [Mangrovivirga sp. M17]|uniref:Class I SAM-dependent methyltransferase n=1 Tax=Mangrovivirga halotolerans TaxID=2993936 RepID=A0ABT3RU84_9BACT|nr:class I SAM-dependent methyltransferase [Mangrovivirga halotolerans]MCX2745340.1 class I SAM-dependent methyltransferase [Mangrovivirga halotolerans]
MNILKEIGKQIKYPRGLFGKLMLTVMTKSTIEPARWTASLMNIQPDDDIIEIGFGNGANIKFLSQQASGGSVTGIEVSDTAIEMASDKNSKAISEDRVKLHKAPGSQLPFKDGEFDKAITVATVYVIEDPGAVFKEMYRVLKPSGRGAVTFPFREKFGKYKPVMAEKFYMHKLEDLEKLFRDAGFINCKTESNDQVRFGAHCMHGEKPAVN